MTLTLCGSVEQEYFVQNDYVYFIVFQDSFWKEVLTNQKVMHSSTVYESVFLIAFGSYGEGPGGEDFQKQFYQRLRGPPFHSSIFTDEQV